MTRVTRQCLWQRKQRKLGNCILCGTPAYGYSRCAKCAFAAGVQYRRPRKSEWAAVNWSQPSADIADQLGVTLSAVSYQRKKLNQPVRSRWVDVDWSQPSAVIARRLKVTTAAVSYQRRKIQCSKLIKESCV